MEIHESRQGAVTVVRPMGPVVGEDAERLRSRLSAVLGSSLGRYVVDASQVAYVDSAGLEALLEATEALEESGRNLALCGVNETLREVLEITELAGLFEFFEDAGAAARSFL